MYLSDGRVFQTIVTTPKYPIGPWQTIRQTYDCGGNPLLFAGFQNASPPNVTGSIDLSDTQSFSVFFTNWNLSDAVYQIQYYCQGSVLQPGSQPQAPQNQPARPTPTTVPTPAPTPTPVPQPVPQPAPTYYQPHSAHW